MVGKAPVAAGREHGSGSSSNQSRTVENDGKAREDVVIAGAMLDNPGVTKNHYGLLHLVRQWIALALKRRSFQLWSRAGHLAFRCGMTMDDVLCDKESRHGVLERRGMDCLYPFLLTPGTQQEVVGTPLQIAEIPQDLWRAIGIQAQDCQNLEHLANVLRDRWVFIRETNRGVSRFYVSPGFARNVVEGETIEQTYRENKKDIADLYLDKECGTSQDFLRGFTQQIGYHDRQGMKPKATRLVNVRLKVKKKKKTSQALVDGEGSNIVTPGGEAEDQSMICEADQLWCLAIPSIDHSFGLTEFIPKQQPQHDDGQSPRTDDTEQDSSSFPPLLGDDFFDNLPEGILDLDSQNDELQLIHELFLRAAEDS